MEFATEFSALGAAFASALEKNRSSLPNFRIDKSSGGSQGMFTFPAKHTETGDVIVRDDHDELTIYFGRFTHIHVGNYDNDISDDERRLRLVKKTIDALRDFFEERTEVSKRWYGAKYGPRGTCGASAYLWSGPLRTP